MHLHRWITSIIGIPIILFIIFYKSNLFFTLFLCLVSIVALWEYFKIVFDSHKEYINGSHAIIAYIIGISIIFAAYYKSFDIIIGIIALDLIMVSFISLSFFKSDPFTPSTVFRQLLGIVYIPLFLSFFILIRDGEKGGLWIFYIIGIVFSGDVGAYYSGTYFGKHKLCPAVSPGKTKEGAIGGLLANVLFGSIFKIFLFSSNKWIEFILFFLITGIAGQIGDLFESELKRSSKIKDSGNILPGHGGILDRIDALLFAAPTAYFFKEYILK